jgi:hypothetical protein
MVLRSDIVFPPEKSVSRWVAGDKRGEGVQGVREEESGARIQEVACRRNGESAKGEAPERSNDVREETAFSVPHRDLVRRARRAGPSACQHLISARLPRGNSVPFPDLVDGRRWAAARRAYSRSPIKSAWNLRFLRERYSHIREPGPTIAHCGRSLHTLAPRF